MSHLILPYLDSVHAQIYENLGSNLLSFVALRCFQMATEGIFLLITLVLLLFRIFRSALKNGLFWQKIK